MTETETPVTDTNALSEADTPVPLLIPRRKVYIAGKPFWVYAESAAAFISVELGTRNMTREMFEDFIQRYVISIEAYASEDATELTRLCDGTRVLGDWLDGD